MIHQCKGRRDFLKISAAGAAGLAAGGLLPENSFAAAGQAARVSSWTNGDSIHPDIDNLRVVYIEDDNLITGSYSDSQQDHIIDTELLSDAMDAMAASLAQKPSAAEAWAAIFQLPERHSDWSTVRAAIKVNTIYGFHTHTPVAGKICSVLMDLGVPAQNIVIFDGQTSCYGVFNPQVGAAIPAGVVVSDGNSALGGRASAYIPAPYDANGDCTADLVNGSVDVLVNLAINKGHEGAAGSTTLSQKNHYGTFVPGPHGDIPRMYDYIAGINRSDAILGTPGARRQQLVIVDSLWGAVNGPFNQPTHEPARLVMGTFGPRVDYAVITEIREALMGCSHNHGVVDRFATEWGYTTADYDGAPMIQADYLTTVKQRQRALPEGAVPFLLTVQGASVQAGVRFLLKGPVEKLEIYTPVGRLIRGLGQVSPAGAVWDGRDGSGVRVPRGAYIVRLKSGGLIKCRRMVL